MGKSLLSKEQQERFRQLYLQGYSAPLIFEKLGFPPAVGWNESARYTFLARRYRKKLGLNVRERKTIIGKHWCPPEETKRKRDIARIVKLKNSIMLAEAKIDKWKKEIEARQTVR